MKIEWLNDDLTLAKVTAKAASSRWWRTRYCVAEVHLADVPEGHRGWRFVVGGDRVYDHDSHLASDLERKRREELDRRAYNAERAKLKNPWKEAVELPPAKVVKR